MIRLTAFAASLLLAACASTPSRVEENVPVMGGESGSCDASRAQTLIGREASTSIGAEAQRLTGGRGIRWIQPGQVVTMDYRPDRINIVLDASNVVVRITCG